jgi:hypothetical protein
MGLYDQALIRYKQNEEIRQQSQTLVPAGADSDRPQYAQRLDNLSKNRTYTAVSNSVNYADPGLLDRAVALPGRFAHQLAKGFVDSTADLVELPELLVNHVGDALGWDPEDRLDVLGNVSKVIRESIDPIQGRDTIADKIAYYVGYSVPDLIGLLAGGIGGAKTIGTGLARLSTRGVLRLSEKTAVSLGAAMGRVSFGALKGGAFGGQEGAVAGAKQFTIMEAGLAALGGYNLPVRVLGSSLLNGGMAAATTDSSRADYSDEWIAAAILGGLFAAMPQHQRERIAQDPATAQVKVKAYVAKEQALGRSPDLNSVLAEFAERDWDYMRAAYMQDPKAETPIIDLRRNLELVYGKGQVSEDRAMLAKQLGAVLFDSGELESPRALTLAENFVRTAEYLSDPDTISGPVVIEKFVDMHRDMLIVPKKKSYEVIKNNVVVDDSGIQLQLSEKGARDWKVEKAQEVIRNKNLEARAAEQNKPVRGWISRTWQELVNPEGPAYDKLMNLPLGKDLQEQIKYKTYDVPHRVGFLEKQVETAANFGAFEGKSREILDTLATIAWHEDKRTIQRASKQTSPKKLPWSEELVDAKKQFAYKWIAENEGPDAFPRYEEALRVGFKALQDLNVRKHASGIISEDTLNAYNANDYLPDKRAVRWRPNKTLYDVEASILLKNDPIFHETFGFTRIDPRLKGATGEPLVLDFEYLVKSEIRKQEYAIAKNKLLRTWYEAARSGKGDASQFARLPRKRYKVQGIEGFLDENQIREVVTINERVKRAMKNARDRRNEKLESGEYSIRKKKTPTEPTLEEIKKEIAQLEKRVDSLKRKDQKLTDWAMQDFDTYDVQSVKHIDERRDPRSVVINDETATYMTAKSMRDELLTQKTQLEHMTKLKHIEEIIEPMEGFEPVPFLRDGKVEYVMLDREAARLTNLNHNVTRLQQKVYKAMSFASGVAPVKFFATAINPVFPIRRWWADNMHFYTANEFERGNILKFTKDALLEQPQLFKDVISDGKWSTKYKSLGGNVLTVTRIAQEDIMLRHHGELPMTQRGRTGWERFVDKMGWIGTNTELTIRVHQFKKMVEAGIPEMTAVRRVNDMLNFGRKGNFMRLMDSIYPFANVAAQALDAQIRAAKGNPKLYAAKLAQYWGLRLTAAWAAYTLADYCMDDVSPYHKVNNFILPIGISTTDANGDTSHAYLAIPTDNSPIVRAIDAVMFAGIDIMRDKTNTLGYEEIINRVSQDVPIYEAGSFLPSIAAFKALYRNQDPRTGDSIWKGSEFVDPSLRAYRDTTDVARNLAQVIPGDISPVGIDRAASMLGSNPITSFMGYLLRDVTVEEKNSMFRTMTEAVPGMRNLFKWTRPQTSIARTILRQGASNRERTVGSILDHAVEQIKEQGILYEVAAREILRHDDLNSLEKKSTVSLLKRNLKGWRLYKHYQEKQGEEFIYDLPSFREWQAVSSANVESKARWYMVNLPRKDDVAYTPYRNLAKAFGFYGSPQFFYHLRALEKEKF